MNQDLPYKYPALRTASDVEDPNALITRDRLLEGQSFLKRQKELYASRPG